MQFLLRDLQSDEDELRRDLEAWMLSTTASAIGRLRVVVREQCRREQQPTFEAPCNTAGSRTSSNVSSLSSPELQSITVSSVPSQLLSDVDAAEQAARTALGVSEAGGRLHLEKFAASIRRLVTVTDERIARNVIDTDEDAARGRIARDRYRESHAIGDAEERARRQRQATADAQRHELGRRLAELCATESRDRLNTEADEVRARTTLDHAAASAERALWYDRFFGGMRQSTESSEATSRAELEADEDHEHAGIVNLFESDAQQRTLLAELRQSLRDAERREELERARVENDEMDATFEIVRRGRQLGQAATRFMAATAAVEEAEKTDRAVVVSQEIRDRNGIQQIESQLRDWLGGMQRHAADRAHLEAAETFGRTRVEQDESRSREVLATVARRDAAIIADRAKELLRATNNVIHAENAERSRLETSEARDRSSLRSRESESRDQARRLEQSRLAAEARRLLLQSKNALKPDEPVSAVNRVPRHRTAISDAPRPAEVVTRESSIPSVFVVDDMVFSPLANDPRSGFVHASRSSSRQSSRPHPIVGPSNDEGPISGSERFRYNVDFVLEHEKAKRNAIARAEVSERHDVQWRIQNVRNGRGSSRAMIGDSSTHSSPRITGLMRSTSPATSVDNIEKFEEISSIHSASPQQKTDDSPPLHPAPLPVHHPPLQQQQLRSQQGHQRPPLTAANIARNAGGPPPQSPRDPAPFARTSSVASAANTEVVSPWLFGFKLTDGVHGNLNDQHLCLRVVDSSPPAYPQISPSDIIIAVDGKPVTNQNVMRRATAQSTTGLIEVTVIKGGTGVTKVVRVQGAPRRHDGFDSVALH